MKILALFVLIIFISPFSANAQVEDLPKDPTVLTSAVHGVKFPLSQKFSLQGGLAKFYGDRLVNTWGFMLEPRYYLSERTSFSLPVYFFSTATAGVSNVPTENQTAVDPSLAFGPLWNYNPIYGKFALSDSIYHFRAGLNAGLLALQLKKSLGDADSGEGDQKKWHLGTQFGVQAQVQWGESWTTELFSDFVIYEAKGASGLENAGSRQAWLYGLRAGMSF
jgi:hypothetical protein